MISTYAMIKRFRKAYPTSKLTDVEILGWYVTFKGGHDSACQCIKELVANARARD
jgi:hypothetical protein